jgi:hypothetical protein
MIHALASFFRGIHMFLGATAPPKDAPYDVEWKFVLMWLGFIVVIVVRGAPDILTGKDQKQERLRMFVEIYRVTTMCPWKT